MNQPLPPWTLHWSSNGELSPMDRADPAPKPQPLIFYFPTAKP